MPDKQIRISGGPALLEGKHGHTIAWTEASPLAEEIGAPESLLSQPAHLAIHAKRASSDCQAQIDALYAAYLAGHITGGQYQAGKVKIETETGCHNLHAHCALAAALTPLTSGDESPPLCKLPELTGGGVKEVARVFLAFTDCLGGSQCGELVTSPLVGKLGFIAGGGTPAPSVGLDFKVAFGVRPHDLAQFEWEGAITGGIVGRADGARAGNSVIASIAPVDQMTTSFTQTFDQSAPGVQEPTKLEDGPDEFLTVSLAGTPGPYEQYGLTLTTTDTTSEPVEIRAYCKGC